MKLNSRKIKGFLFRHRITFFLIVPALIITAGILVYNYFLNGNINFIKPLYTIEKKEKDQRVSAPLTGLLVSPEYAKRQVLAVVVENHPDARPQSGFPQADIVYETIAEGGITRTIALYQSQDAKEIGPIRSARDYFIDWLQEYNGIFVHVGGNIDALDKITARKIPDLNQYYNGAYFWRDKTRYAPHNVYSTTEKLYQVASKRGYDNATNVTSLTFKEDTKAEIRPTSQTVTINFSTASFVVKYDYDPKNNNYLRSNGGITHKDKISGQQLTTKNIIVVYTNFSYSKTRIGEQKTNITTIGRGKALVIQDGKAINAFWEKTSPTAQMTVKNELGEAIKLNPGQTWFEVIPTATKVTVL